MITEREHDLYECNDQHCRICGRRGDIAGACEVCGLRECDCPTQDEEANDGDRKKDSQ